MFRVGVDKGYIMCFTARCRFFALDQTKQLAAGCRPLGS